MANKQYIVTHKEPNTDVQKAAEILNRNPETFREVDNDYLTVLI